MGEQKPFVSVSHLVVKFGVKSRQQPQFITAVDDVSFDIQRGEVVALVGGSGSGKTTIGRALVRLLEPTSGKIEFDGKDVSQIQGGPLRAHQLGAQMIFQDPFGSLNPARTVEQHLAFPVRLRDRVRGKQLLEKVRDLLDTVGLQPIDEIRTKYPHELSGGQRQRVAIARALSVHPAFIVADEPTSMLDVSIRADILHLLGKLKDSFGISFLYITHDLISARYFADKIMVMHEGAIVETGSKDLLENPTHPYSQLLLKSIPGQRLVGLMRQ